MIRKWKLFTVLAGSALIGVTAIAFASDLISTRGTIVPKPFVANVAQNDDSCPPGECSIVVKASPDAPSEVFVAQ
jgi:hypothetical protein